MNYQYRKLPVTIEAFQITEETRRSNVDWPQWLNEAWNVAHDVPGSVYPENYPHSNGEDRLCIHTLEGTLFVEFGDYIIRGVKGEFYPCKPDIFAETYEPVEG